MTSASFVNVSTSGDVTSDAEWYNVTSSPVSIATGGASIMFQTVQTALTVLSLSDNCLSLLVIYGLVRLTSPLRLLTSLSFADMLAAWAMMTVYFSTGSIPHHVTCRDVLHTSFLLSAHNAAALSLASLAVSHHVATFRPLHYDRLVSPGRIWAAVAILWTVSGLLGHLQFLAAAADSRVNFSSYCTIVSRHSHIALGLSSLIAGLSLLAAVVIYSSILLHLRPVEAFLNEQPEGVRDGCRRSTRGVITGVLLFTSYALGWMPYLIARQILTGTSARHIIVNLTSTLLLASCLANPIIYGSRMTTLRDGYFRLWSRGHQLVTSWCRRLRRRRRGDVAQVPTTTTSLNQLNSVCY